MSTNHGAMARAAAALAAGTLFGIGLTLAQMTDPNKVLNFLDLAGPWDPSLLFVLGGAVGLSMLLFRVVLGQGRPMLDTAFHLPGSLGIDRPLLLGSALFGLGWGLAGYCPGPAIASLGLGNAQALWVLPAMLAGAAVQRWQASRQRQDG